MHSFIICYLFMASVSALRLVEHPTLLNRVVRLIDERRRSNSLWAREPYVHPYEQLKIGLHPGHTLRKPNPHTLKSAIKYPKHNTDQSVYGNPDQLTFIYKINTRNGPKKKSVKRSHRQKGKSYIPRFGGLHPGHALLKPKGRMLESAAKFPKNDSSHLVYGNRANFGIIYNKTNSRVMYTGFRRMNDDTVDDVLVDAIRNLRFYSATQKKRAPRDSVVVIAIEPENNEIIDESSSSESRNNENNVEIVDGRRGSKRENKFNIQRQSLYKEAPASSTSEGSSSSSESGDYEKNPGNEYSLFKNRYKQNWMWNHFLSGDHMNLNPYGPTIHSAGPSGPDLFFGRKWWYFNQDDFKPMG